MAAFANQVAVITGAGSGLGRQLAMLLAGEGAAIAAIDLHPCCVRVIERNSRRGRKDVFDGICVYAGILVNFQHRRSALNEIAGQLELQNVHLGGCFCKNNTGPACNEKSQRNLPEGHS